MFSWNYFFKVISLSGGIFLMCNIMYFYNALLKCPLFSQFYTVCLILYLNSQSQTFHCLMPKQLQFICLAGSSGLEGRNNLPAMEWATGSHHPLWRLCQWSPASWSPLLLPTHSPILHDQLEIQGSVTESWPNITLLFRSGKYKPICCFPATPNTPHAFIF